MATSTRVTYTSSCRRPRISSRRGGFEEQLKRFPKIIVRFLNGIALRGDIEFRAKGHKSVPFAFNNGRKLLLHGLFPHRSRFPLPPEFSPLPV